MFVVYEVEAEGELTWDTVDSLEDAELLAMDLKVARGGEFGFRPAH